MESLYEIVRYGGMFDLLLHWATRIMEVAGIFIILLGALIASMKYCFAQFGKEKQLEWYHAYRASLGRSILLGLEFLVAADIIATVAIRPSLDDIIVLGGIVLIRTFLSLALEVEITGKLPWQKK